MAHSGHAQAATHSLLTAIVQCSAYIEGVTPDGLKNLHGKCLEASSQGHARTPSPNATFFQLPSNYKACLTMALKLFTGFQIADIDVILDAAADTKFDHHDDDVIPAPDRPSPNAATSGD